MKVVYICGPFTGKSSWDIESNVRRAEGLALEVAELGAMPLCPHTNTRFFHGTITDEFWYQGTAELMRRADAIMLVEGWQGSKGSNKEVDEATKMGLPVFDALWKLSEWLAAEWLAAPPALGPSRMRDFHYVVSGKKSEKKFDVVRTLGDIVEEILRDEGEAGRPSSDWEIRDGSGALLDPNFHFGEVDLIGRVFFISPEAGVGG